MKLKSHTPVLAVLLFVLAVGYSFAEKVVVIPLLEKADLSDLVSRIEALETRLACVGDLSDAGNFFLNDCNVNVAAGSGNVNIQTTTGSVSIDSDEMDVSINAPKGDMSLTTGFKLDIDSKSGDIGINAETGKISMEAAQNADIQVGATSLEMDPAKAVMDSVETEINGQAQVTLQSVLTTVEGSSLLVLQGAIIDGGATPVARVGDQVIVNGENSAGPFVAVGTIQPPGNPAVLF